MSLCSETTLPLSQLPESGLAHIHKVTTDTPTRVRLLGMGIGKGSQIKVLRNRMGDIVLGTGNNRISLGRSVTEHIVVHVQE
ncbi:MAG: FeoA family protein [Thiolinea sp.]